MSKTRIRVNKCDAAFLYQLLESYEGVCSYSTLENEKGDAFRDVELASPESLRPDLEKMLLGIRTEIPMEVFAEPDSTLDDLE